MTHWYTADPHFAHAAFATARSIDDMNAALITAYASRVAADDDLWIIGDFAFGRGAPAQVRAIFDRIPGRKHLIVGNHDGPATLKLPWTSVSQLVEITDGGQRLVLCHYPMITWNGARRGALQLFGHVHQGWQGSRNSLNAGVDVWNYQPVVIADLAARAKTLPVNKHWSDVEHGAKLD